MRYRCAKAARKMVNREGIEPGHVRIAGGESKRGRVRSLPMELVNREGIEPSTNRLRVDRSTAELPVRVSRGGLSTATWRWRVIRGAGVARGADGPLSRAACPAARAAGHAERHPAMGRGAIWLLADGVGFEPTGPVKARRFSRPVHSTTLPPVQGCGLSRGLPRPGSGRSCLLP